MFSAFCEVNLRMMILAACKNLPRLKAGLVTVNKKPMIRIFIAFGLLLATFVGHTASTYVCQKYVNEMLAGYQLIKENPNESCKNGHKGYPRWSDDPEEHWRWCDSKWVSAEQVERELYQFKAYVNKNCPCEPQKKRSLLDKLWGSTNGSLPKGSDLE